MVQDLYQVFFTGAYSAEDLHVRVYTATVDSLYCCWVRPRQASFFHLHTLAKMRGRHTEPGTRELFNSSRREAFSLVTGISGWESNRSSLLYRTTVDIPASNRKEAPREPSTSFIPKLDRHVFGTGCLPVFTFMVLSRPFLVRGSPRPRHPREFRLSLGSIGLLSCSSSSTAPSCDRSQLERHRAVVNVRHFEGRLYR